MRCEPKRIMGTETVLAFPRPSSSEILNDCNDASIGKTAVVPTASDPEITGARSLALSMVLRGCFTFGPISAGRSFLIRCGLLAGIAAIPPDGCAFDCSPVSTAFGDCFGTGGSDLATAAGPLG